MRLDEINPQLQEVSFEFFYCFSRFEFALKSNKYLKNQNIGALAEPSWEQFRESFKNQYKVSAEAAELLELHPKRQFVAEAGEHEWRPVGIAHCNNDLCKVITMLTTIRNNLFHGGKQGDVDLDSQERNIKLLRAGIKVLHQFAAISGLEQDFSRYY